MTRARRGFYPHSVSATAAVRHTLYLSEDTAAGLRHLAIDRRVTLSDLAEEAIRQLLAAHSKQ